MARLTTLALGLALMSAASVQALTVDEVIKLKKAGVSDSTIELLIKRGGDARSAGVWRQDGWIIHSTETRFPDTLQNESFYNGYPVDVYPQFFGARRFWPNKR
jgi:hypothetical protein